MHNGKRISLILPTYNERDSIRKVIQDFEELAVVDEILVINNNAAEGTSEEVRHTSAIEIHESVQGYGAAIQRGFREATGDLIVVCEPDDTFLARDLSKFLAYSEDVDIVYGSRTVKTFIWDRANMGLLLRWGNWIVAKLLEVLFNTNYLSDVGCTYRMIRREALLEMLPAFRVKSNFFGPEMMVRGYRMGFRCIQVPVNYKDRVGESSVTGDLKKAIGLGIRMGILIIAMRFSLERWLLRILK
ncbi:MAG: glycosyltransferase family 2 protein [Acidobacteria bacterium]|nr:MAG: glycosyltransferase family 2 protein [Acidobacteriota bacterium]